jgi:XTP/dITP diphosphohydrolase
MLGDSFRILSLNDIGFSDEIPENHATIEANSLEKARTIYEKYHLPSFADDTGLEVLTLKNEPGVFSARYAGPGKSSEDNINLLLKKLKGVRDRRARFRTVISLFLHDGSVQFEGVVNGTIIDQKRGEYGFGYDPVFIPEGHSKTFAQLPVDEKNKISHRGIAFRKLVHYLQQKTKSNQ